MERESSKNLSKDVNGRLEFDFDEIKNLLSEDTKMFFLCNPQNPGGTVFSHEELQELANICLEKEIIVCSDEIHADLVLEDNLQHTPYSSLSKI